MDGNPWQVDSLQHFLYLKCPECTFDTQEEEIFQEHAVGNHPLSHVFFGTVKLEEENLTIEECYDQNADNIGEIDPLDSTESTKYMIDCEIEFKDEFINTEIDSKAKDTSEAEKIQNENDQLVMDKSDISDKKSVNMNRRKQILKPRNSEEVSIEIKESVLDFNKLSSTHQEAKNQCQLCPEKFVKKMEAYEHLKSAHAISKRARPQYVKTLDLNKHFKTEHEIYKQSKNHEEKKLLECSFCNITFTLLKKFRKHIAEVHDGIKPKPKCSICSATFSGKKALRDHILAVHEKKRPFKCPMCDVCFSQTGSVKKHIETVHVNQKQFLCSICTYRTSDKGSLKKHIEAVHEGKRPQKCSLCDSSFLKPCELKKHIDAVHEGKRPYSCSECGDSFKYPHHMKRHFARVHEGKKPSAHVHICDLCDRSFKTKDHLKRHISKVHDDDEVEPYKCGFCNDSFKEKEDWKAHEKSVHEGQDPKNCHLCDFKAKPKLGCKSVRTQGSYTSVKTHIAIVHEGRKLFSCSTCKKDLSSKQKLERHIKTVHEGLRPYLCSDCGSSFSTKNNLKQHVESIHEKTKQHMCTVCGEFFSLANYLKRHVQKVHEGNNPGDLKM